MLYEEAEKFIRDIYWSETHNKENKLNLPDVIAQKLIQDNKDKDPEYYDHRDGVVHVSSMSKCLRGVVHDMLGTVRDNPPDARKLGVFKAGNLFEDFIVDALGEKMLDRQTEYIYKGKTVYITGRDDGTILHDGVMTMLEAKSVHSDSFWYREQEGTLVATHNQMQIQTYLWFRRILQNVFVIEKDISTLEEEENSHFVYKKDIIYTNLSIEELKKYKNLSERYDKIRQLVKPDNSNLNGIFSYISKDDCTVIAAPVKFNPRIIEETVLPAIKMIVAGYDAKDPNVVPVPSPVIFSDTKHQWQKNWLATYCDFHKSCCGAGWLMEAETMVAQKNKEYKASHAEFMHTIKKEKPIISVVK